VISRAARKDQPIRRASWRSIWLRARAQAGLPHFRHDLRQTGHPLAAATGARTTELMARMGTPVCVWR